MTDAFRLGASLYVPAVHLKLELALNGTLYPQARSLIACTEDAVSDAELPRALNHLRAVLKRLPPRAIGPLRFIRPRNAPVLAELLAMPGIHRVHGFVIPKADVDTLPAYEKLLAGTDFALMPTLETAAVLDPLGQRELRLHLMRSALHHQILALRIGGNDLLRLLSLKRQRGQTIYESPIGQLIQQLVLGFKPHGFELTAPVCDYIDDPDTLSREARADAAMGLVGKTAIHPAQLPLIEAAFQVADEDLRAARALLEGGRAVFKHNGAMMEQAVHTSWARAVVARCALREAPAVLKPAS